MSRPRVFPDTGVLPAMIVFPHDKHGDATLAGGVMDLYAAGAFELVLGRVVIDELDDVIDRDGSGPQTARRKTREPRNRHQRARF